MTYDKKFLITLIALSLIWLGGCTSSVGVDGEVQGSSTNLPGDPGGSGDGGDGSGNGNGSGGGINVEEGDIPHPILFVTQVPTRDEFLSIATTFGTHLADPKGVPRGGDLMIRYPDGTVRNLTQEAGFGEPDGFQGENSIAVREPSVHWDGEKALFSMVIGSPAFGKPKDFFWQIYEVTGLGKGEKVEITKVANQPPNYNNISPIYASDDRILFTSDRPRSGAAHHYPQLDEYEGEPTNTGLWSLEPGLGELFLMNHSPSGVFNPSVDSFGRVVFVRWDHLQRDLQADEDNKSIACGGNSKFGTLNFSDESPQATPLATNDESFPEPSLVWTSFVENPGPNCTFTGPLHDYDPKLTGLLINHFFPWQINQDGTAEETLNHIGRHELFGKFNKGRNDDPNIFNHNAGAFYLSHINKDSITNFFQMSEDPTRPGVYYGIDAPEFFTHAGGQIVEIFGPPGVNADQMFVSYVTHRDTHKASTNPSPDHSGFYKDPIGLSDGQRVAAHTPETVKQKDLAAGKFSYDFRLKFVTLQENGFFAADKPLTNGFTKSVQYADPNKLKDYSGELWELNPVEVKARNVPPASSFEVATPELLAMADAGINELDTLTEWLKSKGLALAVSRNVTNRDGNDRQQPFNLRIPGGVQTTGAGGKTYNISHLQFYQGDLIRAHSNSFGIEPGRRVLAQPMHDVPVSIPTLGGPPGSVALGPDGSMAALVPARRAMAWQLVDPAGEPVVRERYWITFQPGEVRTCTSCHGQNSRNQALIVNDGPQNKPLALTLLLEFLKSQGEL